MRYLIDTNICVRALRGDDALHRVIVDRGIDEIAVSSISAHELYYGALNSRAPVRNLAGITEFMARFTVLDFDTAAAEQSARVRAALKRVGTPIGHYDVLLAGHALATNLVMVTGNVEEFERVPGLITEDW